MPVALTPLGQLARQLAAGETTSTALTEACLARIEDPAGQGAKAFTRVYRTQARAAAAAADALRAAGVAGGPLAGIPISVKDLFDVAGETTTAGSVVLADAAPATADSPVVARLRAAGAVIVGKTNMTEFAYSGVGVNPHYGTPGNAHDVTRIPGGSSAGAGVAVPCGFSAASIGSDTGGSVRIPAAFNGVVGFKPSQVRVPRDGVVPLSRSQDCLGPLAPTVDCCALVDAVMAGEVPQALPDLALAGLRFAVPTRLLVDGLDDQVAAAFARALKTLSAAGARIVDIDLPVLSLLPDFGRRGGLVGPEAYAWHRDLLARDGARYDPRVLARITPMGQHLTADYLDALDLRQVMMASADRTTAAFDALLCPTVAIVPPRLDEVAADDDFHRLNVLILRNTSVFNILDRPSATVPCHEPGRLPVGLMVVGERLADRRTLTVARAIEGALRTALN
jgi:aspartyl-tRNA(Asn)/glutamyl-tRNA(Gln) amidotransferase subunit A